MAARNNCLTIASSTFTRLQRQDTAHLRRREALGYVGQSHSLQLPADRLVAVVHLADVPAVHFGDQLEAEGAPGEDVAERVVEVKDGAITQQPKQRLLTVLDVVAPRYFIAQRPNLDWAT